MIGISLVGVVAILAASIKSSASHTIQDTLRADFVVTPRRLPAPRAAVPTVVGDRLRKVDGGGRWCRRSAPGSGASTDGPRPWWPSTRRR